MTEKTNGTPFQIPPMSCAKMIEFKDEMIACLRDQNHVCKVALTSDLLNLGAAEKDSPYYIVKQAAAIGAVELEFAKRYAEQYQQENPQNSAKSNIKPI
jgi:hypothetical protein